MKETVCLVTGGFDPVHSGHIAYIASAKKYSDYVVVGINSDQWLIDKKQIYKRMLKLYQLLDYLGCLI